MMEAPVSNLKGIGPKRAQLMEKLGIFTVEDLLRFLPRDYLDYSCVQSVCALENGTHACIRVRLQGQPKYYRVGGMSVLSIRALDETGACTLKWFNQPYRSRQLPAGSVVVASGMVSNKRGLVLINPSLSENPPGILPVYPLVKGLTQRVMRDAVTAAIKDRWETIEEPFPLEFMTAHHLCGEKIALRHGHFPSNPDILETALRRLNFERLLYYLLAVEEQKQERARMNGIAFHTKGLLQAYKGMLPFTPTKAQCKAMEEIAADMESPAPMNRLLQGDVGSGKTAVAMFALYVAARNAYQSVLLAPTELLARQHFALAKDVFGESAVLLTGSMKAQERKQTLERIATERNLCVVGTHALFQDAVRFINLGMIVTDEQHRFGVEQRAKMQEKGIRPDVMVMSATPIPRTLALLAYADLDFSVLDELPPGRLPVKTSVIPIKKRQDMYAFISDKAKEGMQAYVVCPMIEEDEEGILPSAESLFRELKQKLPATRILMLHGRMQEKEKNEIMDAFRRGEGDVLVSTTVIEVGVHVENACFMVVEGADRFGLSQLHQLRGRVGRSSRQAYCFLLTASESDSVRKRLGVLCKTNDGFLIAEEDLAMRGPGDFLGFKQHGAGDASTVCTGFDMRLLAEVKDAAEQIMALPGDANSRLLERANEKYRRVINRVAMN